MPTQIVMLDFDGVVADTLERFCTAMIAGLAELGRDDLATRAGVLALLDDNWFAALERAGLDSTQRRRLNLVFQDAMRPYAELPLFPGMREAMSRIARRYAVVVVTSSTGAVVGEFLVAHGIDSVSRVIGSEVETSKVRKIGLVIAEYPPDARAWYVGDTVGDIVEGRRAGATTVAVTWGWHSAERLRAAAPDHVVTTPYELAKLIEVATP